MSGPDAMVLPERLVSPLARLRQPLHLTGGALTVADGARVEAGEVVAEREAAGTFHVLDATRAGVAPGEVARRLLVAVGESVEVGQPLIKRGRFSRPTFPSPASGILLQVDAQGYLLIRAAPTRHAVHALLSGTLAAAGEGQWQIEGTGAVMQGVWGHGLGVTGLLRLMSADADAELPLERLNAGLHGTLLAAGHIAVAATLHRLQEIGIVGLLLGSLDAALLPLARRLPFPLLLTEGFGALPMGAPFFSVLQSVDGRQATLIGQDEEGASPIEAVGYGRLRAPLLLVPQAGEAVPLAPPAPLALGARVRVLGEPYQGQVGTVEALRGRRLVLPNGLTASSCVVRLEGGERVLLPYTNLERLLP